MPGIAPQQIADLVYLGDLSTCRPGSPDLAVIHACKSPCHQHAIGYTGSLKPDHPHYLTLRQPFDLYLNIIDPPVPLFQIETFRHFFDFAADHTSAARPLLIHCNKGESRSPTLALLHLALQRNTLPQASFAAASAAFREIYPAYQPGEGIRQFVSAHWNQLIPLANPPQ